MGILPLLVVAVATIAGNAVSDYDQQPANKAVMKAECQAEYNGNRSKRSPHETTVDLILAVDTSYCNHYRIEQVKSAVRDLIDTVTNTATGGQTLGSTVRISLVAFSTDIEVLYAFSEYDRSMTESQYRNRLESEISRLSFSDTTDYDDIFREIKDNYDGTFRPDASRVLIIYTNGNQRDVPDYQNIIYGLESMDLGVIGMTFSPQCSGELTDSYNLDKVCPNQEFFTNLANNGIHYSPGHGAIMEVRDQLFPKRPNNGSPSTLNQAAIGARECTTQLPVDCLLGEQGRNGPYGPPGPNGQTGQRGQRGQNGTPGENGDFGPDGFSGQQGDRGQPGNHGREGDQGIKGSFGNKGNTGPQGPKGSTSRGSIGSKGFSGSTGTKGRSGPRGQKGAEGPIGNSGGTGLNGPDGLPGNTGKPGRTGSAGYAGEPAICDDSSTSPGCPGCAGIPGMNGNPGENGSRGTPGTNGSSGRPGAPGVLGNPGQRGEIGQIGEAGFDGAPGRDGYDGPRGNPGFIGSPGNNGKPGQKARQGDPGELGTSGRDGNRGDPGRLGSNGDGGPKGSCGHEGCDGPRGSQGNSGKDGSRGNNGMPGNKGSPGCAGLNGEQGSNGDPGTIDHKEVELLVLRAIRELLQECPPVCSDCSIDDTIPDRTDAIDEQH